MRNGWLSICVVCIGLAGCSVIVDPDESKLGGANLDGGGGMCTSSCDDGVACTIDTCVDGNCMNTTDDSRCGEGERCNRVQGCVPARCQNDQECNNGLFCDGEETCQPESEMADESGCVTGAPPTCNDDVACTVDSCNSAANQCVHQTDNGTCNDGIACTEDVCQPMSGADAMGCVHMPNNAMCSDGNFCNGAEICNPTQGCRPGDAPVCNDTDGNPCTEANCSNTAMMCVQTDPLDQDNDGFPARRAMGGQVCAGGTDCDDTAVAVNPSQSEVCGNARDDNCDGVGNENCPIGLGSCTSPIKIVPVGGAAMVTGDFGNFSNSQVNVCRSTVYGKDAIYYVSISQLSDIRIDTIGSTVDTAVWVGPDTCGFNSVSCNEGLAVGQQDSRVWVHRYGPRANETSRPLFIMVSTPADVDAGQFRLNVQVTSAADDVCTAQPLNISGGGTLTGVVGNTSASQPQGCGGPQQNRRESLAVFQPAATGTSQANLVYSNFDARIYVRAGVCATGSETCGNNSISFSVTTGSSYYLFVDGANNEMDPMYVVDYLP